MNYNICLFYKTLTHNKACHEYVLVKSPTSYALDDYNQFLENVRTELNAWDEKTSPELTTNGYNINCTNINVEPSHSIIQPILDALNEENHKLLTKLKDNNGKIEFLTNLIPTPTKIK